MLRGSFGGLGFDLAGLVWFGLSDLFGGAGGLTEMTYEWIARGRSVMLW